MNSILLIGTLILAGFALGEGAAFLRLPKVTGYIAAGILLNPDLFGLFPKDFAAQAVIVTDIALAFITFSIGGALRSETLRDMGKTAVLIAVHESVLAFALVLAAVAFAALWLLPDQPATCAAHGLALGVLAAALAAPTDPTATLAVEHEYGARGQVSSIVLNVAALDDMLGVINYSLAIVIAKAATKQLSVDVGVALMPAARILGAIALGAFSGSAFNLLTHLVKRTTEGMYIVVLSGLLSLCYGVARLLELEPLLATMTVGAVVVNWNAQQERIFQVLERYTEQLIFVLFFTLSGLHLDFAMMSSSVGLIALFVVARAVGKAVGCFLGGTLAGASSTVKKYVPAGLIPQGGIVIGLAITIKQDPAFADYADLLLSVIIGATVFHELIGPLLAKMALRRAGETQGNSG